MLMKTLLERQSGGADKYLGFTLQPGRLEKMAFLDRISLQDWRRGKACDDGDGNDLIILMLSKDCAHGFIPTLTFSSLLLISIHVFFFLHLPHDTDGQISLWQVKIRHVWFSHLIGNIFSGKEQGSKRSSYNHQIKPFLWWQSFNTKDVRTSHAATVTHTQLTHIDHSLLD